MSLSAMIHLPAVLLSFFSTEFFFFSVSEVILMAIIGKEDKKTQKNHRTTHKELRGKALSCASR